MQPRTSAFALLRRTALDCLQTTPAPPPSRTGSFGGRRLNTPRSSLSSCCRLREAATAFQVPKPKKQDAATAAPRPEYEMTFTCKPCGTRSSHSVSKQAYHRGSVLITCPDCKNRHVIADHLKIFGEAPMTIEQLMKERGQLVKKGTLSGDGDLELWEDGTTTTRNRGSTS